MPCTQEFTIKLPNLALYNIGGQFLMLHHLITWYEPLRQKFKNYVLENCALPFFLNTNWGCLV
jgi:hypothetical protein